MNKDIYYYLRLMWVKLMRAGNQVGCHQMPERSFSIKGYQFPICARCTGVLVGEVFAVAATIKKKKIPIGVSLFLMFLMFVDWFIQYIEVKESTNKRRFITGIAGGFGCRCLYVGIFCMLRDFFSKSETT